MPVPTLWDAVRDAPAALAPDTRVFRRRIRGRRWAVLHNGVSGEQVRVNDAALELLLALDGERSVETVLAAARPEADAASREALAECLLTLETSGLLRLGRIADTARLVARAEAARGRRVRLDPLALRLPLFDPDPWLERLLPPFAPLLGGRALAVVVALVALASLGAFARADALLADLARLGETPADWWRYALLYPLLKLAHELAHALLVKRHGGAVHEGGITLLVLMPLPYVDASDSARFARRGRRIAVSAAGIVAELAVAAVALLLWCVIEPGLLRDAALATALLAAVSTLAFNANPLLRFDGYQILQDAIDVPNLATRATRHLQWLLRRHLLGLREEAPPPAAAGERRWLALYGSASLGYRALLTLVIARYLIETVPVAGVALALFALHRFALRPALGGIGYLRRAPALAGRRRTAAARALAPVLGALLVVAFLPLPSSSRVEGVVRLSRQAELFAATDAEVVALPVAPGARVRVGEPVLALAAPELAARRALLASELRVLETRRRARVHADPVEAERLAADIAQRRRELAAIDADIVALDVRAPRDGRFAPRDTRIAIGSRVRRGESLGHIVGGGGLRVEAIVDQRRVGRVREGVRAARVRLAERVGEALPARLVAETPAGSRELPSVALAWDGRHGTAVASSGDELRTLEPVFRVELALPVSSRAIGIGGRAYVTLVHPPETLGRRGWRAARQLLLATLPV